MIVELTDEEILEFLMTSDLIENYRPDDYKYLIFKFRNFYKILHSKHQLYKTQTDPLIKNLQSSVDNLTRELESEKNARRQLDSQLEDVKKPRKLTLKERIYGKTQ
jgi:predicted RNase H-like nuclease (RuvC/YqgF family)